MVRCDLASEYFLSYLDRKREDCSGAGDDRALRSTDVSVRAPTLGLGARGRVRLITRRPWTDIRGPDISPGVCRNRLEKDCEVRVGPTCGAHPLRWLEERLHAAGRL